MFGSVGVLLPCSSASSPVVSLWEAGGGGTEDREVASRQEAFVEKDQAAALGGDANRLVGVNASAQSEEGGAHAAVAWTDVAGENRGSTCTMAICIS